MTIHGNPAEESRKQFFLAERYVKYLRNIISIIKASVSLLMILVVLIWYDWFLVVSILGGGILYYVVVFRFFQKRSSNLDEQEIQEVSGLVQFWQDSYENQYLFAL